MINVIALDGDYRAPKYLHDSIYQWSAIDFGSEDTCVVSVKDMSIQDIDTLSNQADVMTLSEDLNLTLGNGAVNAAQTYLESLNIPAGWVNTSRTYLTVLKVVIGIFQFNQRWAGLSANSSPFKEGLNLAVKYIDMPQAAKTRLFECFDSLSIQRSNLTNQSTLREILFEFGSQYANKQIEFGGETL